MFLFDTTNQRSFTEKDMPKGNEKYKEYQKLVGGYIETIPHAQGCNAPFTAYANEEGMINDLPSNFLAWGVLRHLGFHVPSLGFYFGNVILIGRNEKGVTAANKKLVHEALRKYLKEMEEEDEEEKD
jgi:hypothetical protein